MADDEAVAAFRGGSPKRSLRQAAVALALLSTGFLVGRLTTSGAHAADVSATARPPAAETALAPAAAVAVTPPSIPTAAASDLATAPPTAAASGSATATPTATASALATTTPTAAAPPAATASGSEVSVPPTEAIVTPRKLPAHTGQSTGSAGVMRGAGRAPADTKPEAIALPSSVPPPPVDPIVQAVQEGMKERQGRGE
jgi:hypothetical protein